MRKDAAALWALIVSVVAGCSTMRPAGEKFPGAVEKNSKAVTRVYPASATRVAWALGQVMAKDPILEGVQVMVDPQSNESRPFSSSEREKLGRSRLARDANYDVKAKSKDGLPVGAIVYLKGESESEVSLLYGAGGDPELSRAILDEVEVALNGPAVDPGVVKASDAAKGDSPRKPAP